MYRHDFNFGMLDAKHAEHFVGERLSDRCDTRKVEYDHFESIESSQEPLCLRSRDEVVVQNPDFDLGHVGWGEESMNYPGSLIVEGGTGSAAAADSGTRIAWLGRINGETSDLSQLIAVPAGVGPSFVHFRYQIASQETNCSQATPSDVLSFFVNGVQADGIVVCNAFNTGATWTDFSFVQDLAAYAGKTIALRIRVRTGGTLPTSVFLDSLQIRSTP